MDKEVREERRALLSEEQSVDFEFLRLKQPELLGQVLDNRGRFNFQNPESQLILTKALLMEDFGLELNLDTSRLIPPVPNRLNYLKWIESLLLDQGGNSTTKRVLDIGTGSSAIYALIGANYFGFNFLASDIDDVAIENARRNVILNGLQDKIKVLSVPSSSFVQQNIAEDWLPAFETERRIRIGLKKSIFGQFCEYLGSKSDSFFYNKLECCRGPVRTALTTDSSTAAITCNVEHYFSGNTEGAVTNQCEWLLSACMSNPPFYDLEETIEPAAHSTCTGVDGEMRTPGGEVL
jgi:hypothetical protein